MIAGVTADWRVTQMRAYYRNHRRGVLAALLASSLLVTGPGVASTDEDRMARLPADQQSLARDMIDFVARMEEQYFARIEQINGGLELETLYRETEDTDYEVRVSRGDVIEKAGSLLAIGKKPLPNRPEGRARWSRFYSLDFHPRTPLVGMLHATIVLQSYEDGSVGAGGWLGVMNGTRIDEDMTGLATLVDDYFARHGRDPAVYRHLMIRGTHDTVAKWRRQPDPAGVSFYGPPVFQDDPRRSWEFIAGLFELFVDEYIDIIIRRADQAWSEADLQAQEEMRRRWLLDQLFSDPFSSELVPFEVWSLANVPPVIRF